LGVLIAYKIEVRFKNDDTRAIIRKSKLSGFGFNVDDVNIVDVYTIDASLNEDELEKVSKMLYNPIIQEVSIGKAFSPNEFNFAIEIGYLPGVTDNVSTTTKEEIEDLFKKKFEKGEATYTSQITFVKGNISKEQAMEIGNSLANPLIQRINIKNKEEFGVEGMGISIPKVRLDDEPNADIVELMNASDEELQIIGKQGIENKDGTRRGPLALDLNYMKAIQKYFLEKNRNPTDIELESIAQTWSEHCKHTIFADPFDEIKEGLYKTYIKGSTNKIRKEKGDKDFCVSVFLDNSGAIVFNDDYLITDKAETHNSPSALDPFGGSITGIVGVNRDTIGFGLGAKPIINRYGFCFADPKDKKPLYKGENFSQKMLSPRMIMEGVIAGVNVGGNCSGIPSPQGFVYFDERYKGKPLVFVGTIGLIPKKSVDRKSWEKSALSGDYIVMVGNRVGKDGIHGATFSSEAMDSGSPATAVQIGDPITQKKLSDAIVKEARDMKLYNSITDNGAGGLSCSVAEMAKECGGCFVELEKVPLKYPGLSPWETWISESQERMTLSISKEKWSAFNELMISRGVEATIIGEFNDGGKCVVNYNGKTIMDVEMDFLHDGLPVRPIQTTYTKTKHEEPVIPIKKNVNVELLSMLSRLNIASFEFISQQFDHEVQSGSILKPLQGKGRVNGETTITRPILSSEKAIIISQGINPRYSDVDTYAMSACAIDTAIRNAIAAGASIDYMALMDNFCWCSSNETERLGQLKQAVKAASDYSIAFGTPFISGKDSMFNDFKGYDENNNPTKISIPPTLLVSSIGVMNSNNAVSIDAKMEKI
jgi:phosphoribosylformylglycinamidine synthase subunit PurSL